MGLWKSLALWWKLREFARRDAEALGVPASRPCANCGKPTNPFTSWISYGQIVCSGACWHALRCPPESPP